MVKSETVVKSALWSAIERIAYQLINFLLLLIVSRLLLPSEFGVIGILMSIIQIISILVDGGFGITIIQKKSITDLELSTIFFSNLFVSVVACILLILFAPLVSSFFTEDIVLYLRIMSVILILNSLNMVQSCLLEREFLFKSLFFVNITSMFVSALISIYLAFEGYGVYSLISFQILTSLFRFILLVFISKWRLTLQFDFILFAENWKFSRNMLLSSLVDSCYVNGFTLFLGHFFSPVSIGYYYQAKKTQDAPITALSAIFRRIMLPFFSKIQDNDKLIKIKFYSIIELVCLITSPIIVYIYFYADIIVEFLYTEKWMGCVPILQLLSISGLSYILFYINIDVFKAKGNSKLYMILNVGSKLLGVLFIILAMIFFRTIEAIVFAFVLSLITSHLYSIKMLSVKMNISSKKQFVSIFKFTSLSIMSLLFTVLLSEFLDINKLYEMLFSTLFGYVFLYIVFLCLFNIKAIRPVLDKIKMNLSKIKYA